MMKKALMAVALFSALPVLAADYSEKTQYLGVVNGQVATMILRPLSTSAGTAMSCPGSGNGYSPPTTLTGIRLSCRRRHTP